MASVFTYDHDPPRVSSPWSTPGSSTPQLQSGAGKGVVIHCRTSAAREFSDGDDTDSLPDCGLTKLDAEPQEGPTEYKLHLLLRRRRSFSSLSTGHLVSGSYHNTRSTVPIRGSTPSDQTGRQDSSVPTATSSQGPSERSRQNRLQQLTTQLLWRLQQSSPFHSSSTANMVLPVLPEATPQLGVPSMPSRLLPGLEESQGALYEIGVSDDGTLVGLTEDELEESLTNLRAMAASLGCEVDVLRKVVVGSCEWVERPLAEESNDSEGIVHSGKLWVAEALVKPDLDFYFSQYSSAKARNGQHTSNGDQPTDGSARTSDDGGQSSSTEQLHLSIIGPSAAGKSSLLGTLSTSAFDNGRGKSRLSLFKHRHEIDSGITSSVAQELIGYAPSKNASLSSGSVDVINYASEKVSAWNDIHSAAENGRLAFVSDLPGLPRYLKSTLRGLVSWNPNYTILCVPANSCEETETTKSQGNADSASDIDACVAYLELCFRLDLPVLISITKMDLASRSGLRETLSRILSVLKQAGRKPLMLSASGGGASQGADLQTISLSDKKEADNAVVSAGGDLSLAVPVVLTSAVTGAGIGKVHALLRALPIPMRSSPLRRPISVDQHMPTKLFDINEVFSMPPSKVYSVGRGDENGRGGSGGMVLCGRVRSAQISVGDTLVVGPLLIDSRPEDNNVRAKSLQNSEAPGQSSPHLRTPRSRPSSGEFSSSYIQELLFGRSRSQTHPHAFWLPVRTVSVRNLRLPVRTLLEGQIGTVGIEPISRDLPAGVRLDRIRKGMILADFNETFLSPSTSVPQSLPFHTGFTATFPTGDFSSPTSPPLILGGNPVVYIGSIRAAAKVTCVALAENDRMASPSSPPEPGLFRFDNDDHRDDLHMRNGGDRNGHVDISETDPGKDITITFSFVSSIEWVEVGARILVIPGTAAAGAPGGTAGSTGLEGFVGKIREVFDGNEE
ncbi:hypothetical protein FQN54_007766 [Arachnomyces sp. PD_36]|nr:hypothetical protein FQN54_007766 [Arachnomyces sp. PD_36]